MWLYQRSGLVKRGLIHKPDDPDAIKQVHKISRQGKWGWAHQPSKYATENYFSARAHLVNGAPFTNTNVPPGYVPEEWTLDSEMAREKAGIRIPLQLNGDWSAV